MRYYVVFFVGVRYEYLTIFLLLQNSRRYTIQEPSYLSNTTLVSMWFITVLTQINYDSGIQR